MTTRDEIKTECLRLRGEGLSGGEVGVRLHMSRSAVLGLWHRHDQKTGVKPLPAKRKRRPKETRAKKLLTRTAQSPLYVAEKPPVTPEPTPIVTQPETDESSCLRVFDLTSRHCRWPTERDEEGWMFCGAARHESSSYCNEHRLRAKGSINAAV
jgi:hypothetical protein